MKQLTTLFLLIGLIFSSCKETNKEITTKPTEEPIKKEVYFYSSDSVKVYADFYQQDLDAPNIILFHQGGANVRSEYKPIIPKLLESGYNILAVDQRVGGQLLGNYNRTVADIDINRFNYCDAYPDLEASLKYMKNTSNTGKIIVWGSSYSATLAIKLAYNNPDIVDAVLAFSPASGEPMNGCQPNPYFESIKTPMLLLRPSSEAAIESVKTQMALAEEFGHQTYVAQNGRHGSSMLVEERVQAPVTANWKVVMDFLNKHKN
ncbi:alpha/beta hydrolase [Hanstruepera ponticola]|uniref:alpha/beta hydrolase n=1 Tax=Hanstruepera ponticola TaxID=2042995 RepID=UPI00178254AF|nr:alpha/beta fold hydrolase [Hanstruepera ponticola]